MVAKRKGASGSSSSSGGGGGASGNARKKQKHEQTSADEENNSTQAGVETSNQSLENFTEKYSTLHDFYVDVINNASNLPDPETGDIISGPFLRLPPKKIFPDYYQLISNPVSIYEIRSASIVKKRGIPVRDHVDGNGLSLEGFRELWITLANNAATYNDPESLIVKDANTILNYVTKRIDDFKAYLEFMGSDFPPSAIGLGLSSTTTASKTTSTANETTIASSVGTTNGSTSANNTNDDKGKSTKTKSRGKIERNEDQVKKENRSNQTEDQTSSNIIPNLASADGSSEDYTADLTKVYRHLLSFKVSHHKNSIPLSKVFIDLPPRDDPETEDYYELITEPMCFNMIGEKMENGAYSKGLQGYKDFVDDVNLIFSNALHVYTDGPYFKAANGLKKAFQRRLEKFDAQVIEKKRNSTSSTKPKSKSRTSKSIRETSTDYYEGGEGAEEDGDGGEEDVEDYENENENENEVNGKQNAEQPGEFAGNEERMDANDHNDNNNNGEVAQDLPTIIRKHDVEKAELNEEIDDITAFIKKFTICTSTNLNNYINTLKNLSLNQSNMIMSSSNPLPSQKVPHIPALFETSILEPAGNSTVGGSTYIMQLPGSSIVGHEISCVVHLQNKIVDEKYVPELKINGESVNGIPISVVYDETAGQDGMFCASKYNVKLGFGLNYFEFKLRVPFPLRGKEAKEEHKDPEAINGSRNGDETTGTSNDNSDDTVEKSGGNSGNSSNSENSGDTENNEKSENGNTDDKGARLERGKSPEFVESVKVWLNVTR